MLVGTIFYSVLTLYPNKLECLSLAGLFTRGLIFVRLKFTQGILKGEVSLYRWPPFWLVWNQLYDNWQFLFLFAKQINPNQSNRRSTVQGYFPFSIPWFTQPRRILLSLTLNIRLGWKGWIKTLAYFPRVWVMKQKKLITLTSDKQLIFLSLKLDRKWKE